MLSTNLSSPSQVLERTNFPDDPKIRACDFEPPLADVGAFKTTKLLRQLSGGARMIREDPTVSVKGGNGGPR